MVLFVLPVDLTSLSLPDMTPWKYDFKIQTKTLARCHLLQLNCEDTYGSRPNIHHFTATL